jgi:hypothetical protein
MLANRIYFSKFFSKFYEAYLDFLPDLPTNSDEVFLDLIFEVSPEGHSLFYDVYYLYLKNIIYHHSNQFLKLLFQLPKDFNLKD